MALVKKVFAGCRFLPATLFALIVVACAQQDPKDLLFWESFARKELISGTYVVPSWGNVVHSCIKSNSPDSNATEIVLEYWKFLSSQFNYVGNIREVGSLSECKNSEQIRIYISSNKEKTSFISEINSINISADFSESNMFSELDGFFSGYIKDGIPMGIVFINDLGNIDDKSKLYRFQKAIIYQEIFQSITLGKDIPADDIFSILHEKSSNDYYQSLDAKLAQSSEKLCFMDVYFLTVFSLIENISLLEKHEFIRKISNIEEDIYRKSISIFKEKEFENFFDQECKKFIHVEN